MVLLEQNTGLFALSKFDRSTQKVRMKRELWDASPVFQLRVHGAQG